MVHQEEINANKAQLPLLLSRTLFKLHLTKTSIGVCLSIVAIISMSLYDMLANAPLLVGGITSLCAGSFGSLANKLRSLVLHGGAVLLYGLSFFLSLMAYATAFVVSGLAMETGSSVLSMICLMLLTMDMIVSAMNAGVELIVIYVADTQRRLTMEEIRRGGLSA